MYPVSFYARIPLLCLLLTQFSLAVQQSTAIDAGYKDGFFLSTQDGAFKMKLGSRLNVLYSYGIYDNHLNKSSFDLIHAKVFLGGHAFSPKLQYFFQTASAQYDHLPAPWRVQSESDGGFLLEDYYLRGQMGKTYIQAGQFKVPFSKQWMTYSGNLILPFRSIATQAFHFGRDRGVTLSQYRDTFWFSVGVFNGSGPYSLRSNSFAKNDFSNGSSNFGGNGHLYVARIHLLPFGATGFSEGDVNNTESGRLEFGMSYVFDHQRDLDVSQDAIADENEVNIEAYSVDLSWKKKGFAIQSEYYHRNIEKSALASGKGHAWYAQPSFFIVPKSLEWVSRYAYLNDQKSLADNANHEVSTGLNIYFSKNHRNKMQFAFSSVWEETAGGGHDVSYLIQLGTQLSI